MRTAKEVGAIAKERRLKLGRTQVEVVQKARETFGSDVISEPTYRALETGRTDASDLTLNAASRGLDWPADALFRVRLGQDPPPDPDEAEARERSRPEAVAKWREREKSSTDGDLPSLVEGIRQVIAGQAEVLSLVRELTEEVRRAQRSVGSAPSADQPGSPA